jgi:hypothetical protein
VDSKDLQPRFNQRGQSEVIDIPEAITERADEKIDVEIREIIRVRPQDFSALKNSFEDWAKNWE